MSSEHLRLSFMVPCIGIHTALLACLLPTSSSRSRHHMKRNERVTMLTLPLQAVHKPYERMEDNWLAMVAHASLVIVYLAVHVIKVRAQPCPNLTSALHTYSYTRT